MSNEGREEVKIRLLTLSDCDYCTWLKSELDAEGISYVNIDANQHSEFSDEIENKFKTDSYPMVFIEKGPEVFIIVSETELETNETLRTFDTIPELIGIIKSYLK